MNLAELKARIEAEALRRQSARDGFTLDAVKDYLGRGAAAAPDDAIPPAPPMDRLTYGYFEALSGHSLIEACYAVLLGRMADPQGLEFYGSLLRRGVGKARVVGAIAYSAEARARGVRVRGLLPHFAVAVLESLRIVGPVVGWFVGVATLHAQRRELRALEFRFAERLDSMARYVGQSGAQVSMRIEALRSVLEARD